MIDLRAYLASQGDSGDDPLGDLAIWRGITAEGNAIIVFTDTAVSGAGGEHFEHSLVTLEGVHPTSLTEANFLFA